MDCCICDDLIKDFSYKCTQCNTLFHIHCIEIFISLKQNKDNYKCPVCKYDYFSFDKTKNKINNTHKWKIVHPTKKRINYNSIMNQLQTSLNLSDINTIENNLMEMTKHKNDLYKHLNDLHFQFDLIQSKIQNIRNLHDLKIKELDFIHSDIVDNIRKFDLAIDLKNNFKQHILH